MSVRAINTCSHFRPSLSSVPRFFPVSRRFRSVRFLPPFSSSYGCQTQRRSIKSLFDHFMEELKATRKRRKKVVSTYASSSSSKLKSFFVGRLQRRLLRKNELQEFIELLASAKSMPSHDKPPKSSWKNEEKIWSRIESLETYAVDACKSEVQRKKAGAINRKNLTDLKVYAIDVDEADELDDALSATKLQDGRIKILIHVADPTIYVQPGSIVDREAMRRGTYVFYLTATYSMFPENLAMGAMSLRQGELCNAVTVSVVLHNDGR